IGSSHQRSRSIAGSLHVAAMGLSQTGQSLAGCASALDLGAGSAEVFSVAHHPRLGLAGSQAYSAPGGKRAHELARGGRAQAADSVVGIPTSAGLEAGPAHRWWPSDGAVSLACRSQAEFSGGPEQEPVLLLWVRARWRRDSFRRTVSRREIPTGHGTVAALEWGGVPTRGRDEVLSGAVTSAHRSHRVSVSARATPA